MLWETRPTPLSYRQLTTKYNMNQIIVTYIICSTDLHIVTSQLYVDQWMTDILHTAHVNTDQ